MTAASPLLITVDGPAGVGKSSLSRRLAGELKIAYLDTGAMFRTIALALAGNAETAEAARTYSADELDERLRGMAFSLQGSGNDTWLFYNGNPVGQEIRTERAGLLAAKYAQVAKVRDFLKVGQQQLGAAFDLVAEGRDMGTVVFPQATCKLFLDARPEVRAQRRFLQLQAMGTPANLDELTEQIRQRDEQDRNRALAPLRPADDAQIIDTSDLNIDAVFAVMLGAVEAKR